MPGDRPHKYFTKEEVQEGKWKAKRHYYTRWVLLNICAVITIMKWQFRSKEADREKGRAHAQNHPRVVGKVGRKSPTGVRRSGTISHPSATSMEPLNLSQYPYINVHSNLGVLLDEIAEEVGIPSFSLSKWEILFCQCTETPLVYIQVGTWC